MRIAGTAKHAVDSYSYDPQSNQEDEKMKMITFFIVCGLMFATGCSTLNTSQHSGALDVRVVAPLKADVAVGEKITGTASMTNLLWLFNVGNPNKMADGISYSTNPVERGPLSSLFSIFPYENLKAAAAFDAVNKAGADVIIAPKYMVDYNDYLLVKTVRVTVTGYKGTIKEIKAVDTFPGK